MSRAMRVVTQPCCDSIGELARVAAGRLGRDERNVARPVAVLAILRLFEADGIGRLDVLRLEGLGQCGREFVADHPLVSWPVRSINVFTRSTSSRGSNGFVTYSSAPSAMP